MQGWQAELVLEVLRRREATPATAAARRQRLLDRLQIRDMVMRYGLWADILEWDRVADLYTDDFERVLTGTLDQTVKGKASLTPLLHNPVLTFRQEDGGPPGAATVNTTGVMTRPDIWTARHLTATHVIRVGDGGREAAAVAQYSLVVTADEEEGFRRGEHEGCFVFDLRKTEAGWRFSRKVVIANTRHNPLLSTPQ